MKRIFAAAAMFAVVGCVGWKVTSQPETSAPLQDVSVVESSETSQPGPSEEALAGIRIRLSPRDFDDAMTADAREVPHITVAAE